jgi:hypothetical protein
VIDQHLGVVLNEVLDAVYQAKQVAWATSALPGQTALRELVSFLIDPSGALMQAEEGIDGRAPEIASPSSHQRGNIVAENTGDNDAAIADLEHRLDAVTADVRMRAKAMSDAEEWRMLAALADGLEFRTDLLRPPLSSQP